MRSAAEQKAARQTQEIESLEGVLRNSAAAAAAEADQPQPMSLLDEVGESLEVQVLREELEQVREQMAQETQQLLHLVVY